MEKSDLLRGLGEVDPPEYVTGWTRKSYIPRTSASRARPASRIAARMFSEFGGGTGDEEDGVGVVIVVAGGGVAVSGRESSA